MRFVGTLMLLGGYILVYAAVANSGEFATEPWAGVLADAYTITTQAQGANASPLTQSQLGQIASGTSTPQAASTTKSGQKSGAPKGYHAVQSAPKAPGVLGSILKFVNPLLP